MDLNIIQHKGLNDALQQGLNHIPLQQINISQVVAIIMNTYDEFVRVMNLESLGFPIDNGQ